MKEALFFSMIDNQTKKVQCFLCPHKCIIADGKLGNCRIRKNEKGKLYAVVYDQYASAAMDPIEKKPLYHFFPGSEILSLGTVGCNLHCHFCQNWNISQKEIKDVSTRSISSGDAVRLAKANCSIGIAYTYNEPLINYEYVLETAQEAHKYGLKNVLVTNGYINEEPLAKLLPFIDAANVDVKSFNNDFYQRYCEGTLSAVLRTVEMIYRHNKHVEITTLLIPGLNDAEEEIKDLCDWVYSLSSSIPLHFLRYFPCYNMTIEATPFSTLIKARKIAFKKLHYIYLGNVWEESESDTFCPNCKTVLIERRKYVSKIIGLEGKFCKQCNTEINIIR